MGRCFLLRGLIMFGCLAVALQQGRAADAPAPTANHLTVELRDGSKIVGDTDLQVITIDTEMTGIIKVPVSKIASLQLGSSNTACVVMLRNGDRLKGAVQDGSLILSTLVGKITLPMTLISKFSVSSAGDLHSALTEGLVFDDSLAAEDGNPVKANHGRGPFLNQPQHARRV